MEYKDIEVLELELIRINHTKERSEEGVTKGVV